MQNVAESYVNKVISEVNSRENTLEIVDGDAFTKELNSRLAQFDANKIENSMNKLANAFPGADISSKMIGNFASSSTFFLELEGGTSINISPEVMENLGDDEKMFEKVKNMIGKLFTAGEQQPLMPSGANSSVTTRTVNVDLKETSYVEVQRDANGRATSLASFRLKTQQIVADQMQKLFDSLGGTQSSGGGGKNGNFSAIGSVTELWALLDGKTAGGTGIAGNQGGGKVNENGNGNGFTGMISGSVSWSLEGRLFTNTSDAQQILDDNKQLVGQMDVIIDMWEQSGTSADLFSYMQIMGLSDPLVFDLGDEGINLTSPEDGVYFDIKGDGSKPKTGWISGNNAFLYLDESGNGVADNANELFGDQGGHKNGFEKLAQYDDNFDGVIDANDAVYNDLRLWRDLNSDGVNQLDESLTMAEAGIASVDLGYEKKYEMDEHGNVLGERSSFTRTDGSRGAVVDAWLKQKK